MKFIAWLDCTPNKSDISRRELYKDTEYLNIMPNNDIMWLIDLALNAGLCQSTKDGLIDTSWHELKAWGEINNHNGWILNVIKKLSKDYVSFYYQAKDQYCDSPIQFEKKEVAGAKQLKSFLLARKKHG